MSISYIRVHNRAEMMALLKEAANADNSKYHGTRFYTHAGEPIGKSRVVMHGIDTSYQVLDDAETLKGMKL